MLEPEKLQNRRKQGWPDAGKGTVQPNALGGKQRLPKQGSNVCSTSIYTYKFLHALRGCSRSLPRCATGNGLQTTSLAACSGSPHNARIH